MSPTEPSTADPSTADPSTAGAGAHSRGRTGLSRAGIVVGAVACAPLIASCATGFGAPTRHAVANLQAAEINVGKNLEIRGLIVALPHGEVEPKGGVAYIEFTATNLGSQSDELQQVGAQVALAVASPGATGSSSAPSAFVDVADQQLSVSQTTVPANTAAAPGGARIVVALDPLTVSLSQGDYLRVSLRFTNGGSVDGVNVPVLGADQVGSSFLPSAPPSLPSSPPASPASSALESPASSPAAGSAPASSSAGSPAA